MVETNASVFVTVCVVCVTDLKAPAPGVEFELAQAPQVDLSALHAETAADLGSVPQLPLQDEDLDNLMEASLQNCCLTWLLATCHTAIAILSSKLQKTSLI